MACLRLGWVGAIVLAVAMTWFAQAAEASPAGLPAFASTPPILEFEEAPARAPISVPQVQQSWDDPDEVLRWRAAATVQSPLPPCWLIGLSGPEAALQRRRPRATGPPSRSL